MFVEVQKKRKKKEKRQRMHRKRSFFVVLFSFVMFAFKRKNHTETKRGDTNNMKMNRTRHQNTINHGKCMDTFSLLFAFGRIYSHQSYIQFHRFLCYFIDLCVS